MIETEPLYDNPKNPHTYKEEFISKGNDFEVYGFDERHVVKIPNTINSVYLLFIGLCSGCTL